MLIIKINKGKAYLINAVYDDTKSIIKDDIKKNLMNNSLLIINIKIKLIIPVMNKKMLTKFN